MPKLTIRYLKIYADRHGKKRVYLRKPGCKPIKLPDLDSPEFLAAYGVALAEAVAPKRERHPGRTVDNLILDWMVSRHFTGLQTSTQSVYRRLLNRMREQSFAALPVETMQTRHVRVIVNALSGNAPTTAARMLRLINQLMEFAIALGWIEINPAVGIKLARRRPTEGIHSWTDAEIEQYEAFWPSGTPQRMALALLLYTGQRRSDAVRIGPADIQGNVIHLRQVKTRTEMAIPIHRDLANEIEQWHGEGQTFLTGARGAALSVNGFYNVFKDWCRKAGLPERCSPHGLRKAAARRLAEAGCSTHEIAAITGHRSLIEIGRYTRAVAQAKMAESALAKL